MFTSNLLILFFTIYFSTVHTAPELAACGKDGQGDVAHMYCSDGHNIVKWKMGSANFDKFHRTPNNKEKTGKTFKDRRPWPEGPSNTQAMSIKLVSKELGWSVA